MKKIFICVLTVLMVFGFTACKRISNNGLFEIVDNKQSVISTEILDDALSRTKYYSQPFSISMGELINAAMDNYKITYMTGKESIEKGYVLQSEIDESIDLDYFYYAIISGDTMVNPDIPYLKEYEKEAAKVWLYFDEEGNLLTSGVELCKNLSTCAIIIMTSTIY